MAVPSIDRHAALIDAQAEFPEIPKDAKGSIKGKSKKTGEWYEFEYRYASLPMIQKACFPILHNHGLGVAQTFDEDFLITKIFDAEGVLETSRMRCSPEGLDPQKYGAKITYYRRYSLAAILGIAPDEDADAAGVEEPETVTPPPPRNPVDAATDALIRNDADMIRAWSPGIQAKHVTDLVTAFVKDRVKPHTEPGEDLYEAARRRMSGIIDERTAEANGNA